MELVERALDLVGERGIAALSTRALADAVGLSSGAIFRHFSTLDALLDAVVDHAVDVLSSTYPDDALPAPERLAAFVTLRAGAVGRRRGILRLVVSEQFVRAMPPAAAARLQAAVRRTLAFVHATVSEGQVTGSFRADLPAEHLAMLVVGTVHALVILPAASGGPALNAPAVAASILTLLSPAGNTPAPRER